MTIRRQLTSFIRNLFGPTTGRRRPGVDTSLADTARDMRYVNMSVEDNRLNKDGVANYTKSFE